ncbi:hypothetical protein CPC08DRAFT_715523 [Agrocybe pediades]|nr:hypothetical protein CPC08DRAFT_715523 [Agrocybe pediades]
MKPNHLSPDTSNPTPSSRVHAVPELLHRIAEFLPWQSLMNLGYSDHHSRDIVQHVVKSSIKKYVMPFVNNYQDILDFFDLLKETGGVIAGLLPWSVMSNGDDNRKTPLLKEMDIYLPLAKRAFVKWTSFLERIGYDRCRFRGISVADGHEYTRKSALSCKHTQKQTTITITVSYSASVTPLIATASCTTMTHILTPSHILCFYPELYAKNVSIKQSNTPNTGRFPLALRERDIILQETSSWGEPCGSVCPEYWRRSRGLPGVAIAYWGGFQQNATENKSAEDELGPTNLKWKWNATCRNGNCPNTNSV